MNRTLSLSLVGALAGGLLAAVPLGAPTATASSALVQAPTTEAPLVRAPAGSAETRLNTQDALGGVGETDVAFDPVANRYLVVWSASTVVDAARGSAGTRQSVVGQYVDATSGAVVGDQLAIASGATGRGDLDAVEPSVAWDAGRARFVVVYAQDTLADIGPVDRTAFQVRAVTVADRTVGDSVAVSADPVGERDARQPDVAVAASTPAPDALVVAWQSAEENGLRQTRLTRLRGTDLTPVGDSLVANDFGLTVGDQSAPSVAVQRGGSAVVTWTATIDDAPQARLFIGFTTSDFTPLRTSITSNVTDGGPTSVTAEVGADGALVAWSAFPSGGPARVTAGRVGVVTAANPSFRVLGPVGPSANDQLSPAISANRDGEAVVSWIERQGVDHQVRTARLTTGDTPVTTGPFTLSTLRGSISTEPTAPAVAWSKGTVGTSFTTWSGEASGLLAPGESEAWGRIEQGPRRLEADLGTTLTVSPSNPAAPVAGVETGDVITWTLGFSNAAVSATEVDGATLTLSNDVGADLTDLVGSITYDTPGVVVSQTSADPLRWTLFGLDPGESGTITVQSRVVTGRPSGTVLQRTSSISAPANTDANAANDAASATATSDDKPSVVSVTAGPSPVRTTATATVRFSEAVTGFTTADVAVGATTGTASATVTGVSCSGQDCTVSLATTGDGTVRVVVPASATATDASGKTLSTGNLPLSSGTVLVDTTRPTIAFDAPAGPVRGSFGVSIIASEAVTGLEAGDFVVTNATFGSLAGSGAVYTLVVTPTADGPVTVSLPAGAVADAAGNPNLASPVLSVDYDGTAPTVSLDAAPGPFRAPYRVTATFSESVTGVQAGDFSVTAGSATIGDLQGSGTTWSVLVSPTAQGPVTVAFPAGGAVDRAGNANTAATPVVRTFDSLAPTATLSTTSSATVPVNGAFPVTLTFSESVSGVVAGDVTVVNGTVEGFAGSGDTYTFSVRPTADGEVSVSVADGAGADTAANPSAASNTITRTADLTRPSVVLTAPAEPVSSAFAVTATFSETVTGLEAADFSVTNGTVTAVTGSGTTWTVSVRPTADGDVVVALPAGAASDAAGNTSLAGAPVTTVFDGTRPSVVLDAAPGPFRAAYRVTATFSESVTGVQVGDFAVTGGTAELDDLQGSGTTWSVRVSPSSQGAVTVAFAANRATDAAGNGNTAATPLVRTFDSVAPTATLTSESGPVNGAFAVTLTFSESVAGVVASDVTVVNGTVEGFAGSGTTYTFDVRPTADGEVSVSVTGGAATDAAGNPSAASNTITRAADLTRPTVELTAPAGPLNAAFTVTATFSEAVTGLTLDDVEVAGGTPSALETVSASVYRFTVTPAVDGTVTVGLPANAATDVAGNGNEAATPLPRDYDATRPTVTLTAPDGPLNAPFMVTGTFSEPVTGLQVGDLQVTGAGLTDLVVTASGFTVRVVPTAQGEASLLVVDGAVRDAAGNPSTASDVLRRAFDSVRPDVTLTAPAGPVDGAFTVTATFSETVTGVTLDDVAITNGVARDLAGSGATYTFTVEPSADGDVTVTVIDGAATDAAGNTSTASTTLTRLADATAPTATITSSAADPTSSTSITLDVVFSEPVTGLALGDLTVTGGVLSDLVGSADTYGVTLTFDPAGDGATVGLPADAADDAAGNGNAAATPFSTGYDATAPTVVVTRGPGQADPARGSTVVFTVTASEPVGDLAAADLVVTGTAGARTATVTRRGAATFQVSVTGMRTSGGVGLGLAAGALRDRAGNGSAAVPGVVVTWLAVPAPQVGILFDHRCLPGNGLDGGQVGIRLTPATATTLRILSTNAALVPPSRVRVVGRGAGDPRHRLVVRPVPGRSGVAIVTVVATNAAGTARRSVRVVVGTNGPDRLVGTAGVDLMFGRHGDDVIRGGAERDLLCGGPGRDRLDGQEGRDALYGGAGDDVLFGGRRSDVLVGGRGRDVLKGGRNVNVVVPRLF
ncbi:Ig-like domain-containing protein [Nocardioides sp. C4-1]|uniref:Ig-like domain-containing protein n=1 Tax=Nocardioides sp. C4-1 TaxID=3151851 RepID=UPI0032659BDB